VVFISTPHRGSYLATGLARTLARRFVSLPAKLVQPGRELAALAKQLDLPKELRRTPTSIDGMSPSNPVLLTLAEIPLAPHVSGHSIIPVLGEGDYREGKDGLVTYRSAHIDYVDKEDLELVNHLSGETQKYLKLSFKNIQDFMTVRSELQVIVARNQKDRETKEAYEGWYNPSDLANQQLEQS
jgi:hypothetical protein